MPRFIVSANERNCNMDEEKLNSAEEQPSGETSGGDKKPKKIPDIKGRISGMSKKKKIIAIIVIIVIVIAAMKGCGGKKADKNTDVYTYDTAVRTGITEVLTGEGTLEPADKYTVTTLLKGDVLSDTFEEGDIVEKDAVLYEMDSSDMENSVESAQLSLASAQRNYNTAAKSLDDLNVKSKASGVVTDVLVKVGDNVGAGQEVAKVRDDSTMTLELPFPADEADTFYTGQSATVTLYGSFETLPGRVASVSGATQVMAGNMIVRNVKIDVENPGAISDSQLATAEVGTSGSTQSGTFEFKENRSVYAEVGGEVAAIVNDEGSKVSNGSTIVRLTSDSVTDAVASAADGVRSSELNLDSLNDTLEDYTITSPIKGTVIEKKVKAGDTIDSGAQLCTIYDLSYLKITMNVDELDINKISLGQEVTVTADAVTGKTFTGKVTKINMAGTTTNGVTTYPVEVQIEDMDGLLPGMNVSTEIIVNHAENVIAVPAGAVVRGDSVLVKTGGKSDDESIPQGYEYVQVETGISDDNYVEIKSGINEGDEIAYMASSGNGMMFPGMMMG